jgi:SAM-dependent methyltransferase
VAIFSERSKLFFRRVLPPRAFHVLRDLPFAFADLRSGHWRGEELVPPIRLMRDGPRSREAFIDGQEDVVPFYRDVLHMAPDACVLDIGCGLGRKAIPLLDYLDGSGRYIGIDIDPDMVEWCTQRISTRNPRFTFITASIHNSFYNPGGALSPDRYVFPFPDRSFDHVVLWSVFTHLLPETIEHYLAEVHRMLKPGGRMAASFFILDKFVEDEVQAGRFHYPLTRESAGYWTSSPNMPEHLIAVEETWLVEAIGRAGFTIDEIRVGSWSNHPGSAYEGQTYQDILVATA